MVSGFQEKPTFTHFINAGVYVFAPTVLSYLTPGISCDMPELLQRLQNAGVALHAFPLHENWLDVGLPETLDEAQNRCM